MRLPRMTIRRLMIAVLLAAVSMALIPWERLLLENGIWWDTTETLGFGPGRTQGIVWNPRLLLGILPALSLILVAPRPNRRIVSIAIIVSMTSLLAWLLIRRGFPGPASVTAWPDQMVLILKICHTRPDQWSNYSSLICLYKIRSLRELLDLATLALYLALFIRMLNSPIPRCGRSVMALILTCLMIAEWTGRMLEPLPPKYGGVSRFGLSPFRLDIPAVDLADITLLVALFGYVAVILCGLLRKAQTHGGLVRFAGNHVDPRPYKL